MTQSAEPLWSAMYKIEYRGFVCCVQILFGEAYPFRGRVQESKSNLTFEAKTAEEIGALFRQAVDCYLAWRDGRAIDVAS